MIASFSGQSRQGRQYRASCGWLQPKEKWRAMAQELFAQQRRVIDRAHTGLAVLPFLCSRPYPMETKWTKRLPTFQKPGNSA